MIKKLIILYILIINISYALTENENKMINAVKIGDIKTIQNMLSQNVNPNIKDERGYSLIHIAAENNQTNSIKTLKNSPYLDLNKLLDKNTKIIKSNETIDASYFSAIDIAAIYNNFETLKLLIDYGANINFKMIEKPRSEFVASRYSNSKILKAYLDKNIYLLMNSEDVISIMKAAIFGDNVENINYLVRVLGIDVDTKDTNTMLHYASGVGAIESMKTLISLGANIDNTNSYFQTSLHYILDINANKKTESVKILLDNNANINLQETNGNTPLHLAIINARKSQEYSKIIDMLLAKNANVNITNNNNETALNIAVKNNDYNNSIKLINKGSDVNHIDKYYSPLHMSIKNNNIELAKALIDNGANISLRDKNKNYSPLNIAIEVGNFDICKLLVRNGAAVDNISIELAKKSKNENIRNFFESSRMN
ncbi:ankyrin repeat-containing protein [Brachyspira pilosicoli]|uniref:ankyrin repeat domain-containing protein n=1 Tax=Brachyspira pilosicoli TaxID=52584 RepID=UPI000E126994|nr:ankyrin repeat domain-containing protein [Brachyspira pilosicoli]SUW07943.1 ankyrin repeat-containing protein [Brachyspira pilosicoli]